MIGPDYKTPPAPMAKQWEMSSNSEVESGRQEYADWWRVFNDDTLTHLIEVAYRQNLTLRAAGVRVLEARAQLGHAIGELYPQKQELGAEVNYNHLPLSLPYQFIQNTYWSDVFGVESEWEIDVWGKIRRGIQSGDDSFLASVADYDNALVTLTGDVATTYVKIRTTQAQINVARQNVEKERLTVMIVKARHEGGVATGRDVDQAENVLGTTEATIPQLTAQLVQEKDSLSVLLGLPAGTIDELLAASIGIPSAPQKAAVGIPADLLRRRPDIRSAELQAAAQCAQIGVAKADLLPAFALMGTLLTLSTNINEHTMADVFIGPSLLYQVGPRFRWDILNYGQITNNVRYQDAKYQELLVDYQNTVLKAQQEVGDGIVTFVESKEAVVFLQESVRAAEGALRIAIIQYREGIADFTTVLTAEQNLYSSQNSLAMMQGQVPLGLIAAFRAMGGGWQIRDGHDFVPPETEHEMADRTNWGTLLTPDLLRPKAPGLPSPADTGPLIRAPEW
jgi:NodT family efflux transporter outer membrane factor (OMF) lipoprotein